MHVTVFGTGYTGLITSLCLCEFGHSLSCFDINNKLIENLKLGISNISFSEPGIDILIRKHLNSGTLHFYSSFSEAMQCTDAIIITIPVKGKVEEDIDLNPLMSLITNIAPYLTREKYTPIFIKTSVPVGTCSTLASNLEAMRTDLIPGKHYDIINNPNFFREGSAIHDFMRPDRIILGLKQLSQLAKEYISELYSTLKLLHIPFIYTNFETAELIKSATVGLVTIKMAFTNEIEKLCKNAGVDLNILLKGIGSDRRISGESLIFNAGVGGSSLPRTSRLLISSAKKLGVDLSILSMALDSNIKRIQSISDKILQYYSDNNTKFTLKKVAIFGLSFKPLTDDIRESPSIFVIKDLLYRNIEVSLYDPYYLPNTNNINNIPKDILSHNKFNVCNSAYEAVSQSDVLVVMTNWPEFIQLDMPKIRELMNKNVSTKPILFDCLNMFIQHDSKFNYIAA